MTGPSDLGGYIWFLDPGLHPGLVQIGPSGLILHSKKYLNMEST